MALLKEEFSTSLVEALGGELRAAQPSFPFDEFIAGAAGALKPLELTQRRELITDRLVEALPADFGDAAKVLHAALESPTLTGWMTMPVGYFVAVAGLADPEVALPLLARLTPRFTSEGPIRPFIEAHPELTFDALRRWLADPDEHVRRLVSEGTRPRLPWAPLLRGFIADPTPCFELLDALVDDPSLYVRRSVANHLNDVAKDHPDIALAWARQWQPRGDDAAWTVKHGLRTLVKQGNPGALALMGVDVDAKVSTTGLSLDADEIAIGQDIAFTCTLVLKEPRQARLVIDYRVHYMGARGPKQPKVFKLATREAVADEPITLTKRHALVPVSIRTLHPGTHRLDIQVNGQVLASTEFELLSVV